MPAITLWTAAKLDTIKPDRHFVGLELGQSNEWTLPWGMTGSQAFSRRRWWWGRAPDCPHRRADGRHRRRCWRCAPRRRAARCASLTTVGVNDRSSIRSDGNSLPSFLFCSPRWQRWPRFDSVAGHPLWRVACQTIYLVGVHAVRSSSQRTRPSSTHGFSLNEMAIK